MARRREAQRARRVKDDFLANLSHELRTPLSAIIGYNSILTEELHTRLNEDQRVAFDRIQANSQKLLNLIETVLLLNSLDAGELQLDRLELRRARDPAPRRAPVRRRGAPTRSRRSAVEGDATPLWVTTDEHKLERVLWALIDNAVKFTPDGSIALAAQLAADRSTFEISVRDTGVGIHNADIAQLVDDIDPDADAARPRPRPRPAHGVAADRVSRRRAARAQRAGGGTQFTIALPVFAADPRDRQAAARCLGGLRCATHFCSAAAAACSHLSRRARPGRPPTTTSAELGAFRAAHEAHVLEDAHRMADPRCPTARLGSDEPRAGSTSPPAPSC